MWVLFAFGSALFAGLTAVLAKIGIRDTDTDVATALRTVVVLLFSWLMAWLAGSLPSLAAVSARTWVFLALSGLATGGSWLCYFRALQLGDINKVAPIDKSSTVLTMALAFLFLGEALSPLKLLCMALIGGGAYLMIQRKPAAVSAPDIQAGEASAVGPDTVVAASAVAAIAPVAATTASDAAAAISGALVATHDTAAAAPSTVAETPAAATAATSVRAPKSPAWLLYALGSAVFASLTSILGKVGIENVNSTLGTAIRTCVVLAMAWAIVFLRGKQGDVRRIGRRSLWFLILSGFATGASWLCYYRALQTGPASVVVPIDKLSILVSIAFARVVLGERLTVKAGAGLILLVAGTLLLLL